MFNKLDKFTWTKAKQNDDAEPELKGNLNQTAQDNKAQHTAAKYIAWQLKQEQYNFEALKADVNALSELWKQADKDLKLKGDKTWAEKKLNRADKVLEENLQIYAQAKDRFAYWQENINWLQKRFPEAKYTDVTGLCKVADKTEYADEQDYSLNAGRYVGVVIEDEFSTEIEFKNKIQDLNNALSKLHSVGHALEIKIASNIKQILS